VVRVENARQEQRWPRYIPRAVEAGLRSQIGVQLYVDEETLGGLNLYSTSSDTLDESSEHVAELFATHAALALGHARHAENLSTAISSRKSIGQAIGILMERYEMDEDRAFQFLVRVSTTGTSSCAMWPRNWSTRPTPSCPRETDDGRNSWPLVHTVVLKGAVVVLPYPLADRPRCVHAPGRPWPVESLQVELSVGLKALFPLRCA